VWRIYSNPDPQGVEINFYYSDFELDEIYYSEENMDALYFSHNEYLLG
jgi:hypothetical protein